MPLITGPRVLSIQQPWASAIAKGHKRVENRSWSTRYRGTVYIHASSKLDRHGVEWLESVAHVRRPAEFTQSAIVAVANISDVVTKRQAQQFEPWFFGPYGFVLKNIRSLPKPVRTKGKLGLFRPSPALIRSVNRQLEARR